MWFQVEAEDREATGSRVVALAAKAAMGGSDLAAESTLQEELPSSYTPRFRRIVPAAAWEE
jgi:hypothetical protein